MKRLDSRGILLVEALLAVSVISITLLILVGFFSRSVHALTGLRVKRAASHCAEAELKRAQAQAKVGQLMGNPPVPVPVGYNALVSSAGEQAMSCEELTLFRQMTIVAHHQGTSAEYKSATIALRDTMTPARFPPVTMHTEIRLTSDLDLREATGLASLSVQVQDTAGQPIPAACAPRVSLTGPLTRTLELPPPGHGLFTYLPTSGFYDAAFSASACGYWPKVATSIALTPNINNVPISANPIELRPVAMAEATIRIVDPTGARVEGANVSARALGMPAVPGHGTGGVWGGTTDANGELRGQLPIPDELATTYNGWSVDLTGKAGFFTDTTPQPFMIDVNNPALVERTLYPILTATINVRVRQAGSLAALEHVRVRAHENGDQSVGCSLASPDDCLVIEGAVGNTDNTGNVTLTVRINLPNSPMATNRDVQLWAMLAGWQRKIELTNLQANSNTTVFIDLQPATFYVTPEPVTSVAEPIEMHGPTLIRPFVRTIYNGHLGLVDISTGNLAGLQPVSKSWSWSADPPNLGIFFQTVTQVPYVFFASSFTVGEGQIDAVANFSFSYAGGEFGPATGPLTYSAGTNFRFKIYPPPQPHMNVFIWGLARVGRDTETEYTAFANYTGGSLPTDTTYRWEIIGASETDADGSDGPSLKRPTNERTVMLRAGSREGIPIRLKVTVASASLGMQAEREFTVDVGFSPIQVALSCGANLIQLRPYERHTVTATASGGSGTYTYEWNLENPITHHNYGPSSPAGFLDGPPGLNTTTFQANVTGLVSLRGVVRDPIGNTVSDAVFCGIKVDPPGGSF